MTSKDARRQGEGVTNLKSAAFAMILAYVAGASACASAPTRATPEALAGCYTGTDDLRYNSLQVLLKSDGTYYAELNGDIAQWGSATGTWQIEGDEVTFAPTGVEDAQPLPPHVDILRRGTVIALRLPGGKSPGPSGHFEPLKSKACDGVGWQGAHVGRKGAPLPLADGEYTFQHRFAEHPSMPSVPMHVRIRDGRIAVTNNMPSTPFPVGIVAEGLLLWNGRVGKWIIAHTEADRDATEAGGCSDGPEVVDLEERVYWTC